MARTPAPTKVLSELAPPVAWADWPDSVLEAESEDPVLEAESELSEAEALALSSSPLLDVGVEVDSLSEDMVEVIMEAAGGRKSASEMLPSSARSLTLSVLGRMKLHLLEVMPEVEGVELEKDAREVSGEPASETVNWPDCARIP